MQILLRDQEHRLSAWLFLRLLGLVYLIAFLSLWPQVHGLIGSQGILPAGELLDAVGRSYGAERYWLLPTLGWLSSSDLALHLLCGAGAACSLLLLAGLVEVPALLSAYLLYLSLCGLGRDFMGFQWDALLLEAGALALFLAPLRLCGLRLEGAPRLARWLLLWLLFRLMFGSGVVKLASGDPTWRDLTALHHHFETQPLPHLGGWWAHQLPGSLKRCLTGYVFVVELLAPLLLFVPGRARLLCCALLLSLQAGICLTGNYTFFNLLSGALCLLLIKDATWRRLLPARLARRLDAPSPPATRRRDQVRGALLGLCALLLLPAGATVLAGQVVGRDALPGALWRLPRALAPWHVAGPYGLFAVMTTTRHEIVLEGSDDGKEWRRYGFRDKPSAPGDPPRWVQPHQPRLDWQMWFAALGEPEDSPWLPLLCLRLLQGSPPVVALLGQVPFERPPRYLRARLHDFRFTSLEERRRGGAWWATRELGPYLGPFSLQE